MKKYIFLFVLFFLLSFSYSQNGFTFKCGGYTFTVYEDDTPLEYSFIAGDDIDFDFHGRVKKIGEIDVKYDFHGRVKEIGNVNIKYEFHGKIKEIGDLEIKYDFHGRMTGSSGSINCDWQK